MVTRFYPEARKMLEPNNGSFTGGPYKGVLHTTESPGWAHYKSGTKPHLEVCMQPDKKVCYWRQFYPFDQPARALVDKDGNPLRTNRDSAIQVEISGTCTPGNKNWGIWYVGNWPDWLYTELRDFVVWAKPNLGIQFKFPTFQAYPKSYGPRGNTNTVRFSNRTWDNYNGWCGHQHVPENVHGDPGALDKTKLMPPPPTPAKVEMVLLGGKVPILKSGMVDPVGGMYYIKRLQQLLKVPDTGKYDTKTVAAVKAYDLRLLKRTTDGKKVDATFWDRLYGLK